MLNQVHYIVVTLAAEGQRIDNFLFKTFKNIPKSRFYKLIREGQLRVNKKRTKPDYKLQPNDIIRIPPLYGVEKSSIVRVPLYWQEQLKQAILVEQEDFLVLNKPAGIAVHGGTADPYGVIEALRQLFPANPSLELVHRLDKETSGCLLIAKNRQALLGLQQLFKSRKIEKHYLLLVHGKWPASLTEVTASLVRGELGGGQRGVRIEAEGKISKTYFTLIEHLQHQRSLVKADLQTGRMHQIRVHAAQSGYPIIGDKKYGDWEKNKQFAQATGSSHLYLHALSLKFVWREGVMFVEAPLPDYFDLPAS